MRVASLVMLFGCGRLGFGTTASDGASGGTKEDASVVGDVAADQQGVMGDAPLCTSLAQLTYNFDGSNSALWMPYEDPSYSVTEASSQLVITLPNNKTGTAGYFSTCKYDLTGQRVFVTAATVPSVGSKTDMYLAVGAQGNAIGVNLTTGAMQAYRINGASYTQFASVAYNAAQHKVWQMRESGGTVFWEVSADGTTFTTLYSAAPPIAVTSVQLLLFADEAAPVNNPGTAAFAKLNLP